MPKDKKEEAFALFNQGKQQKDPEVLELGIKKETLSRYFRYWKQENTSDNPSSPSGLASPKGTDAQTIRFVPRVYTTTYTSIMRAAQDAAVEFWKWPADMGLEDFLDTALHLLFKEHGITLAGYSITDEAREALEAELKEQKIEATTEEVTHGG